MTEERFAFVKVALERFAFVKSTFVNSAFVRLAPERLTPVKFTFFRLIPTSDAFCPKKYPEFKVHPLGSVAPDPRRPPVMRFAGDVEEKFALVIVA